MSRIFEIKEVTSPLDEFENYRGKVRKILKQVLEKMNIKSYITMKIRMSKVDQEGESIETDAGFNEGTRALISKIILMNSMRYPAKI